MFRKIFSLIALVLAAATLSGCAGPGGVYVPAVSVAGVGRHAAVAVSTPPVFIPNAAPVVATPVYNGYGTGGYGVSMPGTPNCFLHATGMRVFARSAYECRLLAMRAQQATMPVPAMPGTYGGPAVPFPQQQYYFSN